MTNESEGWTLNIGDLVKMKAGYSAPGTVLEVSDHHPKAKDPRFCAIKTILDQPHARVFWSDHEEVTIVPTAHITRFKCE